VACAVEAGCPYSAPRLYRELLDRGEHRWPLSVVVDDFSPGALDEALRNGPYGRCVYACDNDAVDHQVVALEFPGPPLAPGGTTPPSPPGTTTATFTMTAFSRFADRSTRLFGTRAELTGDGETIRVYDFLTRAERLITPAPAGAMNPAEGHAGGDAGLMDAFTAAVATGNRELISSGPRESLASHLAVFAAERARLNGTVETIPPYAAELSRTDRGDCSAGHHMHLPGLAAARNSRFWPLAKPPGPGERPIIRSGCHIHVVSAAWLGHPRLMNRRRARVTRHDSVLGAQQHQKPALGRAPPPRGRRYRNSRPSNVPDARHLSM
jgi:hypothetical protein